MLDDADAGRFTIAALVASAAIAALLASALGRSLASAKRRRADPARHSRDFPDRDLEQSRPLAENAKIEPRLLVDEVLDDTIPFAPRRPSRTEDSQTRGASGGYGKRAIAIAFIIGVCIGGVSAPWAWQNFGRFADSFAEQIDALNQAFATHGTEIDVQSRSGVDRSGETDLADLASPDAATGGEPITPSAKTGNMASLEKNKLRLPREINPGIALVAIDVLDDFLDLRIKVSRSFSENERKLFLLTATDRTIYIICQMPANADLRELTERGYDVRVTYVDAADERMRRDILASPLCPERS